MTKRESMAKVLTRRVGIMAAGRVISFVALYGSLAVERGERVSMEDYAEAWGYSKAKAYRDLGEFRRAIPEFEHPYDLVVAVAESRAGAYSALATGWGIG